MDLGMNINFSLEDYKAFVVALHETAWCIKNKIYYEAETRFVSTDEDKKSRHKQLEELFTKWLYIEDTLYEIVHDYLDDALKLAEEEDRDKLEGDAKEAMWLFEGNSRPIVEIFKHYKVGVYAKG